jgi:hypothetical protein
MIERGQKFPIRGLPVELSLTHGVLRTANINISALFFHPSDGSQVRRAVRLSCSHDHE